jgi:hypothetical protein
MTESGLSAGEAAETDVAGVASSDAVLVPTTSQNSGDAPKYHHPDCGRVGDGCQRMPRYAAEFRGVNAAACVRRRDEAVEREADDGAGVAAESDAGARRDYRPDGGQVQRPGSESRGRSAQDGPASFESWYRLRTAGRRLRRESTREELRLHERLQEVLE